MKTPTSLTVDQHAGNRDPKRRKHDGSTIEFSSATSIRCQRRDRQSSLSLPSDLIMPLCRFGSHSTFNQSASQCLRDLLRNLASCPREVRHLPAIPPQFSSIIDIIIIIIIIISLLFVSSLSPLPPLPHSAFGSESLSSCHVHSTMSSFFFCSTMPPMMGWMVPSHDVQSTASFLLDASHTV